MTPRQEKLLIAIVEEFIETSAAVGSLTIPEKYNINASSATIRSEMSRLVDSGYLSQAHASSGRIPTTVGIKYYLEEVLEHLDSFEETDHIKGVRLNEDLYQIRYDHVSLIQKAVRSLHDISNNTALILYDKHIYISGLSSLVHSYQEENTQQLDEILSILENYFSLFTLFKENHEDNIKIMIGEDFGFNKLSNLAVVFTPIRLYQNNLGYIAIVGQNSMDYAQIIPTVRFVSQALENSVYGW